MKFTFTKTDLDETIRALEAWQPHSSNPENYHELITTLLNIQIDMEEMKCSDMRVNVQL